LDLTPLPSQTPPHDETVMAARVSSSCSRSLLETFGRERHRRRRSGRACRNARGLDYGFVSLDLHLPDGLGLDLLREKCFAAGTGAIVMTSSSQVQHAVEAMRLGALGNSPEHSDTKRASAWDFSLKSERTEHRGLADSNSI